VEEALKIALQRKLKAFKDGDAPLLAFPPEMDNIERRWVHQFCKQLGLESKSSGKGDARCVPPLQPALLSEEQL
jgi:predicted RNA-binding protein Jag